MSIADRLGQLHELYLSGAIDQSEYEQQKSLLLASGGKSEAPRPKLVIGKRSYGIVILFAVAYSTLSLGIGYLAPNTAIFTLAGVFGHGLTAAEVEGCMGLICSRPAIDVIWPALMALASFGLALITALVRVPATAKAPLSWIVSAGLFFVGQIALTVVMLSIGRLSPLLLSALAGGSRYNEAAGAAAGTGLVVDPSLTLVGAAAVYLLVGLLLEVSMGRGRTPN